MTTAFLSISIPAYNDARSLEKLIDSCVVQCERLGVAYDILIINDGSVDNTLEVAETLAKKYKNITIHNHIANMGFGPTLKEVFTLPTGEWILFLPGDNQFPAINIETLFKHIKDSDFILGCRRIRKDSIIRLLYAGLYNKLITFLSGYRVDDVNGIVLFHKAKMKGIELNSKTAFIHAELFLEANRKGLKTIETNIVHNDREFGRGSGGKWSVIIPCAIDLFCYFLKNH